MRSNRPRVIATLRKTHARALHARNHTCCTHGTRERAICGGGRSANASSNAQTTLKQRPDNIQTSP
eukprot:2567430-Lingulodinium_polyedra.AAC.1